MHPASAVHLLLKSVAVDFVAVADLSGHSGLAVDLSDPDLVYPAPGFDLYFPDPYSDLASPGLCPGPYLGSDPDLVAAVADHLAAYGHIPGYT